MSVFLVITVLIYMTWEIKLKKVSLMGNHWGMIFTCNILFTHSDNLKILIILFEAQKRYMMT